MADQLLSQADVDALVSSLSKSEPAKPAAPAKPVAAAAKEAVKPAVGSTAFRPGHPAARPVPVTGAPTPACKMSQPVRQAPKAEITNELVSSLNTKITELSSQVGQIGAALKRLEMLERKVTELENHARSNQESTVIAERVQLLSEEFKKIATNLKGTPGYGIRHSFNCEKCDDQGHVAVQFRCTNCGHERWYGWWPKK